MKPFGALAGMYLAIQGCNPAEPPRAEVTQASSTHPNQEDLADCLNAAQAKTSGVLEKVLKGRQLESTQVNYTRACLLERERKDCLPKDPQIISKFKEGWNCTDSSSSTTVGNIWTLAADEKEQKEWQEQDKKALRKESKGCKEAKALECVGEISKKIDSKREEAIKKEKLEFTQCHRGYAGDVLGGDFSTVWVCEKPLKF